MLIQAALTGRQRMVQRHTDRSKLHTERCNRVVFGLDGEFVGFTREDYDRALETKYGKACTGSRTKALHIQIASKHYRL